MIKNKIVRQFAFLSTILYLSPLLGFGDEPCYVNSREIVLSYQSVNKMPVETVRIWARADAASEWRPAETTPAGPNAVIYRAPRDGTYRLYLVLENRGGASATPPTPISPAHLNVVVDTTPPTLQIHRAVASDVLAERPELRLLVTLVDENLGENGTRIFYRANADGGWVDAGVVQSRLGSIHWQPPADLPATIDIRLVATDQAGNRAVDELLEVPVPHAVLPAEIMAAVERTGDAVVVPLVEPVEVEPVKPITLAEDANAAPRDVDTAETIRGRREAELLRQQASTFLAEGRYSLAGARLESALDLKPDDPDALVDLGGVYYRNEKYDLADEQYQRALQINPDNAGAIEGLALIAATQKRYPDARAQLEHLLKLRPNAADHWLHFGDVEHMLGDRTAARAAWEKALQLETADKFVRTEAQKRLKTFQAK